MSHKITIKNLGPLKNIENFEIRKVNMVIGESASGKSLLAKAISIFNDRDFLEEFLFENDEREIEDLFEAYFPNYKNYTIVYYYNDKFFIEVKNKKKFNFKLSHLLEKKLKDIKKEIESVKKKRNLKQPMKK